MKRALVCGAGGFIGGHLVKRLRREGYWVRGVDLERPEFAETHAHEFQLLDLRDEAAARTALDLGDGAFDEVYQLAADMGGMGFIHSSECEVLRNNALINLNMVQAAVDAGADRYFFSSSVCVYRDMAPGEPELAEDGAYPAQPDNETTNTAGRSSTPSGSRWRSDGATACRCGSRASRTAMGPRARGGADARRRPRRCAARWRKLATAE
jgi:nucleoside-diphosphate-sugar epimerase